MATGSCRPREELQCVNLSWLLFYRYRYGESGSMECDMSLERHLVHSWKIHGVSTSEGFSVSGCLVGCTYK